MKKVILTFVCVLSMACVHAQKGATLSRGEVPCLPVDTLPTDRAEVRLVTYSDGTFRFIPTNPFHFLSAPAYCNHWDTINLWAYRTVPIDDLPERFTVEMAESHGFAMPVNRADHPFNPRPFVISRYGRRNGRDHNGIDLSLLQGQPIYAAFDGVVRLSRWNSGGFGHIIIVRHNNGLETYYAHLSRRAVAATQWVRAGQVIGYGGDTGRASAPHLHFEVRYFDHSFDPEWLIDFNGGELLSRTFSLTKDHFSIGSMARSSAEPDRDTIPLAENTSDYAH
jgi:hypothetical protein